MSWSDRFEAELLAAERARLGGNEGRARVCARRAAAIVAAEFLARRDLSPRSTSALHILERLRSHPALPPAASPAVDHLLLHVDAGFRLPAGVDLIGDARFLRRLLVPEDPSS